MSGEKTALRPNSPYFVKGKGPSPSNSRGPSPANTAVRFAALFYYISANNIFDRAKRRLAVTMEL
jgi:hypothetical protein